MRKKCVAALVAIGVLCISQVGALVPMSHAAPPSKETNRVLVAVQNPAGLTSSGATVIAPTYSMQFLDALHDQVSGSGQSLVISGWTTPLPAYIQNLPVEQMGAVYSENGSLTIVDYSAEAVASNGVVNGLSGTSSGVLLSHDLQYVYAANQHSSVFNVIDRNAGTSTQLSLPGVYGVAINPGGSVVIAFVQDSNVIYFLRRLSSGDSVQYAGGPSHWPANTADCEPFNLPTYCLIGVAPSGESATTYANAYFDRPVKALLSSDGSQVYVLNSGKENGGSRSSVVPLPVAPMLLQDGTQSGTIPTSPTQIIVSATADGLVSGTTLYVAGQQYVTAQGRWGGVLSVIDLPSNSVTATYPMSDGIVGRMVMSDDNMLWIGSSHCNEGIHYFAQPQQIYGCLSMFNTATGALTIDSWIGDVTGIAAITGLHKVYYTEAGQVHIRSTQTLQEISNVNVTVAGTAVDVAYMDATSDSDNTVY